MIFDLSAVPFAAMLQLGTGVPTDVDIVGFAASEIFGTIPTPEPADDVTFDANDFCLAFACHGTLGVATAVTFSSPWTLQIPSIAPTTGNQGRWAAASCRYGDAVFGADQYGAGLATAGSCGVVVMRNVLLADPIGDFESTMGNATTITAPALTLEAPGASIVLGVHMRRGSSATNLLSYPNAPLTAAHAVASGLVANSMRIGRSSGVVVTAPTVSGSMPTGATAERLIVAIEVKKVI